ncbi:MAG: bifunctional (p)ppGpp synthetase/guanosine-3',5'-bis(diphosphate) 3'-pyrophosphohydrolase [Bacteroidales bacterium]|nr:bifunctional (p)ppGpp synthetase/guanosine-3',5'-bis(diphosphate) 3'-pyrophosphohydrolase [Bacteroidales bacterium]MBR4215837.1 bifunctional (p)ppGpp synthetase/guanosine-3',5'-bis(diphosphate) 3'-pyrophosphohydrolase [Bacteroidales bacterium]
MAATSYLTEKTPAETVLHRKAFSEEDTDIMFERMLASDLYFPKESDKELVRKAYDVAKRVHHGQKRTTGDSFIYHLFDVMSIVVQDIGLGSTGAAGALLHEITFHTDLKIEDVRQMFGQQMAQIVDSLARIKGTSEYFKDSEPEVYKKIILGLTNDLRIILIKLADRLSNLRTLEIKSKDTQYQVAYETMQIYVTLAHRLGLNKIKTELEDLSFKFLNRKAYDEILAKLQLTENERKNFINKFSLQIIDKLSKNNIKFDIKGRPKSIFSIYQKMLKKKVTFDEVFDKFAIRIIFTPNNPDLEKEECLYIVKVISEDFYVHPERTRDWITMPKGNGYEAYHLTVFDEKSKAWVEIQIRSQRMDEIAEYGFAAHWKYKGISDKRKDFDDKLKILKQKLEAPNSVEFDFSQDFKFLISDEISVYSQDGRITTLPQGATVLDFAYYDNPEKASSCIGAKVNHKMVTIASRLQNGDLVEPVTSNRTKPKPEWLSIVHTEKAVEILKEQLHDFLRVEIAEGQRILHNLIQQYKIVNEIEVTNKLIRQFACLNKTDLLTKISNKTIQPDDLEQAVKKSAANTFVRFWRLQFGDNAETQRTDSDVSKYIIGENLENNYELADCCNPIPGDEAIGLIDRAKKTVFIHKKKCLYAVSKIKENPSLLIPVSWKMHKEMSGTAKLVFDGVDQKGIAQRIITTISQEVELNLKTIHIESDDTSFSGWIEVYVRTQTHINKLVKKLREISGILNVTVE